MSFSSAPWTVLKPMEQRIKEKIEAKGVPLKDWAIQINRGILTGYNSAFIVEEDVKDALIAEDPKSAEILKPLLNNHTITKYRIGAECRYLINSHNGDKSKNLLPIDLPKDYPAVHRYILHVLEQHKSGTNVRKRGHTGYNKDFYERTDQGITPFNLRHCAYLDKFESPKIVWKQTSAEKTFAFDDRNRFLDVTGQMLTSDTNDVQELKYILGILNSRLMDFYVRKSAMAFGVVGVRWIPQFIERLPFVRPDTQVLKKIETLVNKILLKKSEDKDTSSLERKIDALVYELYGLTQEEIAVVEKQ